jgi:Ca2+-binding RTX toxin-like protein
MYGGTGNDTYTVGSAGDVVVEGANAGIDRVKSAITYMLGANVENLTLTGTGAIDGTGNSLANTIVGNGGNNVLAGNDGNDQLYGGAGNDTLYGGSGSDRMEGGTGNDTYTVGSTGDVVVEGANAGIDRVKSAVTYTLGSNVENLTLTGTAAINGTGNTLGNTIAGNGAVNTLAGGLGNDTLTGGGGADVFLFASALGAANIDTITDMTANVDKIHLDNAIFAAFAAGNLGKFTTGASASGAGAQIVYNSATGALSYDSDGAGGAAQQQFAILSTGLGLDAQDFYIV